MMMTHYQLQTKTPTTSTCASCPHFDDFKEPNGRGWCMVFDRVAYQHHPFTQDCQLNLPTDTIAEEEQEFCKYREGDMVKVIDKYKDHSQWETFVVIGHRYNSNAFKTTKSYLTEPEWYILIATIDKPVIDKYWKAETQICHADHSAFIETEEVF